jgi:hypothetical protein
VQNYVLGNEVPDRIIDAHMDAAFTESNVDSDDDELDDPEDDLCKDEDSKSEEVRDVHEPGGDEAKGRCSKNKLTKYKIRY